MERERERERVSCHLVRLLAHSLEVSTEGVGGGGGSGGGGIWG